jgi:hypothetical protein
MEARVTKNNGGFAFATLRRGVVNSTCVKLVHTGIIGKWN